MALKSTWRAILWRSSLVLSQCNWEVARNLSPFYVFFLKQLLLLSELVVVTSFPSLKEQNFVITFFLPLFLLHSLFEKLEAVSLVLPYISDIIQSFCGAGQDACCQPKRGCSLKWASSFLHIINLLTIPFSLTLSSPSSWSFLHLCPCFLKSPYNLCHPFEILLASSSPKQGFLLSQTLSSWQNPQRASWALHNFYLPSDNWTSFHFICI